MASASTLQDFNKWLDIKLQELNTDEAIFGSYICGILDCDETLEEKSEALQGILTEIVENTNDINKIANEMLEKWYNYKSKEPPPVEQANHEDLDIKLAKLLESQSLSTTKQKQYTDEEKKIREAILSQYSEMTDSEDDEAEIKGPSEVKQTDLEKNVNAATIAEAEKAKREQARLDSQRKKEKDKEDREKQKQMKEEKKEKRKTQKGERRR